MNQNQTVEFTFKAIFVGVIIGIIMTAANVYLGLYAGMTVSASIPAAVLAMGIFRILRGGTIHQSNIVQTIASAGESLAAGIIFTLPALVIIGTWADFKFWPTTLISISGGLLGIIFMIPLRRALIIEDKSLTYPEGVACATVLKAGEKNHGEKSEKGAIMILQGILIGGLFKFLSSGIKLIHGEVAKAFYGGNKIWFMGGDISPALLAVGYIVKLEVAMLVFIGGCIGWLIGIPVLSSQLPAGDHSALDMAWTLWSTKVRYLGVGAMLVGGAWSILSVRQGIIKGIEELKKGYRERHIQSKARTEKDMGLGPMIAITVICLLSIFLIYNYLLGHIVMSFFTTIIMVIAAFIFVAVSSYIVGLVGSSNNPVSGMTISALLGTAVLFLAFGLKGNSAILATLGVAAVVCCAACTAGDCSQDLKTGVLIGSTPRNQQWAQVIGVLIPAFVIAPVLSLLHEVHGIGTGLKAPQATLFASITNALFGKGDPLPYTMLLIGVVLGVIVILIDQLILKPKGKFRLYIMPMAVGIYLPITLAVPMLLGGIIHSLAHKKKVDFDEGKDKGILMSSGLIAGEAIMGIILAIFVSLKVAIPELNILGGASDLVSVAALLLLGFYLFRMGKKSKS